MYEQSKAARRRFSDGAFHARYFVGEGIDIGGKPDPLSQYCGLFARMTSVRTWDLADGDAQVLAGVADGIYDLLHSSHCLEHMRDVREALKHWIRIVKPGGFLVITVPDEDLYEQGRWPSPFNPARGDAQIGFYLEEAADVSLKIYTLQGRLVRSDARAFAGGNQIIAWNGRSDSGARVTPGGYVAVIEKRYGSRTSTQKLKIAVLY